MRGRNNTGYKLVPNVVIVNLNVLCTLMKSGIANDEDSCLTITIHWRWREK